MINICIKDIVEATKGKLLCGDAMQQIDHLSIDSRSSQGNDLFIPIIGLIYLVEVLSVIIQVTYFKKTGGKRIFKMAPIHHHFELCGWSETRVVAVFSIITAILCLVGLLAM